MLCVPIRIYLLPLIFTNHELTEIDNETLDDLFEDHDDPYGADIHNIKSQLEMNHDKHEGKKVE